MNTTLGTNAAADLTVALAAAELSVHPETIRRLLLAGHLSGYKAGRHWRISRASLAEFKASGGARPVGRPQKQEVRP